MAQAAQAVSHTQNTYLGSQFRRFARPKGIKRAGRRRSLRAQHRLARPDHRRPHRDLGVDYLERTDALWAERQAVRRLERLATP